MPPRRSSRAASTKPASKAADKPDAKLATKPAARGRAKTTTVTKNSTKRAASPENSPPPPAKRSRPTSKAAPNGAAGTNEKNKDDPEVKSKETKAPAPKKAGEPRLTKPIKPPFNALPTPPPHIRPAPQLFVWGAGNFGQFGLGPDNLGEHDKPRRNQWVEEKIDEGVFGEDGAGLEAIAAGGLHSLFIDEKGTVWSCGNNDNASLGRVTTQVPNPDNPDEFLDTDTVTSYPYPLQSLVDEGFRAVRIAAGDSVSAAISDKGELRVWGTFRGVEGDLGFSSDSKLQNLPVPILDIKSKPSNPEKFVDVAAGNNHLLVLTTHGNVYASGASEQGQLGRKVLERRKIHGTTPEKIILGNRTHKAVVVGAGSYTSFAVDEQGTVWAWGLNNMGQTGTGFASASADSEVPAPKKVVGLSRKELKDDEHVVQIAGGEHHTLFRTSKGRVFACGRSDGGQLGLAKDDEAFKEQEFPGMLGEPVLVTFPDSDDPIIHISAGIHNNLAVSQNGALYSWGTGPQGELGTGGDEMIETPRMIVRREGGSWAAVLAACGGQHCLALLKKKKN
ncbi:RCC1/BLIP-II [Panus rudis PR-1116 ss-1]|nr:RCC1/BLIP-II [Panus rudis PR-1116 ss-1]